MTGDEDEEYKARKYGRDGRLSHECRDWEIKKLKAILKAADSNDSPVERFVNEQHNALIGLPSIAR
jgi:hypothetical protein